MGGDIVHHIHLCSDLMRAVGRSDRQQQKHPLLNLDDRFYIFFILYSKGIFVPLQLLVDQAIALY